MNARTTRSSILPWHGIVLVAACLGWLGGCVVTDKIEFEVPPNTPPSIVVTGPSATPPGVPIDRIVRVNLSASPPPVILAFDVNPDVNLYGKVVRGYKSGGFNIRASSLARFSAGSG